MWKWFHKLGSPPYFFRLAERLTPWFGWVALVLLVAGTVTGLAFAPEDYQQGDGFRIIYVHVPSAWMSMFVYVLMATAAGIGLVWRMKLAHAVAAAAALPGASFTFLALATGSIWGKPMWGTWWEWDARLTSELVLLFLFLGFIALRNAYDDTRRGDRAAAVLALIGVVNVPIIHFSVEWWATLHQGPTVTKIGRPEIAIEMLVPLLVMAAGFMCYFAAVLLMRTRSEVLQRERHAKWVREAMTP